jgi:hypothetical protein
MCEGIAKEDDCWMKERKVIWVKSVNEWTRESWLLNIRRMGMEMGMDSYSVFEWRGFFVTIPVPPSPNSSFFIPGPGHPYFFIPPLPNSGIRS